MEQAAIDLVLRPSAAAHRALFWVHVVPLVILPFGVASTGWLLAIAVGIGGSWLWCRRHRAFGYGRGAICRVAAHLDGRWTISGDSGAPVEAELLGGSVIAGRFLILNFRLPSGQRRSRVLFGDESSEDGLRRLRVRVLAERH